MQEPFDLALRYLGLGAPTTVAVRRGAGAGGSDRVTLIWSDASAVRNQWLRVTVLAGGGVGLAAADVFCFGNAVGEVGDSSRDAMVNTLDVSATRANQTTYVNPPEITNPYDFNRDQRVNTLDVSLARSSQTTYASTIRLVSLSAEGGSALAIPAPVSGGLGEMPSDPVAPLGGGIVASLAYTAADEDSAAYAMVPIAAATGAAAAAVAPLTSTMAPATSAAATRLAAAVRPATVPTMRTTDALAVCAASSMPWAPLAGPVAR